MGCKCFSTRSELYNDINMDNLKDNSMINNNQEPQMISQFLSSKSDNQNIPNQKNKNSHARILISFFVSIALRTKLLFNQIQKGL